MRFADVICVLLICQAIGEVLSFSTQLPIPGPVIGMVLLVALQIARPRMAEALRPGVHGLLSQLTLYFVPAAVGIMQHTDRIAREWLPIVVTVVISTILAMAVAATVVQWARRFVREDADAA